MTEKTSTGFPAGEYLQFQKDVVPEVAHEYNLGKQASSFDTVYAQIIPLNFIPYQSSTSPYSLGSRTAEINTCFCADNGGTPSMYVFSPNVSGWSSTTQDWAQTLLTGTFSTF